MKKLSDNELDIMLAIWRAEKSVGSSYVAKAMEDKNWAQTTVLNFLSRLVDKGYIKCEKEGRNNIYTPLVKEKDYLKDENKGFLEKFYNNSIKNMIAGFYDNEVIDDEDLKELKEFIEKKTNIDNGK
ncbi:MAG: BlaI/MecI/CopY family transcriptional regulator [Tissierellia bacterium]|nr:BlaI/MecI/CopY family transcriptional regulator [Tissierellia bacterium]